MTKYLVLGLLTIGGTLSFWPAKKANTPPKIFKEIIAPLPLNLPSTNARNIWRWEKIPPFRMPKNSTWVMSSGFHNYNDFTAAAARGFTHIPVEFLEKFPKANLAPWKLYGMIYQNTVLAAAPHFGNDKDTRTTPQQMKNAIDSYVGARSVYMKPNREDWCDILDIDVEMGGNDKRFFELATTAIAHAKSRWKVKKALWFATSPYNYYEKNVPSNRFLAFDKFVDFHAGTPYVYLNFQEQFNGNIELAIQKTGRWIYDEITWIERNQPHMGNRPFLSWWFDRWANFERDEPSYHVRPDIAEGYPIWYCVLGAARNGGGMVNWKAPNQPNFYHGVEDFFVAGMYRTSRANSIFEHPEAKFNQKIEFSLDGGGTWQTDERTSDASTTDTRPYVRAVATPTDIVLVAVAPFLEKGTMPILVRRGNWQRSIIIKARETFMGIDKLNN